MKVSGDFYAQWFDEGPVQAPPKSLVHGTLKWILKRLNEGLVRPTTCFTGFGERRWWETHSSSSLMRDC